jgi:putative spermidine/putrescine transport system substrate-binding protein
MLAAGDVAASMVTAGRLFAANVTDKKNFKFEWNQSIYAVDFWAVLKNSPNREQAMQFIAFASRPDIQSKIPTLIALGATNKEAIQLVNPKEAPNNPSDPERLKNALAINPAFWVENADQLTQRFNAWAAK